jgi:hypothetical protein
MKNNTIKPNLTSLIRHEMITPLACILGLLGCLSRTKISEEQKNYLHDIEDSVAALIMVQNTFDAFLNQVTQDN